MEENNEKNYTEAQSTENYDNEVKVGEVVGEDGFSEKDKQDNKFMAILSYIGVLALVPYVAEKNSSWVKYHAIQGVNLFIIEMIGSIIGIIPFAGTLASFVIGIYTLIVSIIGIVNVCNGEAKELPGMNNFKFVKQ